MQVEIWQIILVTAIAFFYTLDRGGTQILNHMHTLYGWVVGMIFGDPMAGIAIGATIQLMALGVAGVGGAAIPNYTLAAIVGAFIASTTDSGEGVALTVGITVGMLAMQLEILVKMIFQFIEKIAERVASEGKYRTMNLLLLAGPLLMGLTTGLPMFLVAVFGVDLVNGLTSIMPAWLTSGLNVAAGALPAVGMAMLLSYMPAKKYFSFLIVGYVLSAYLNLAIVPIALLGVAAAYGYYTIQSNASQGTMTAGELEDE